MDLQKASELAREELNLLGLQHWAFNMSYTLKTTFGRCNIRDYTIELSAILTHLNSESEVINTIRHEAAHAFREIERGNTGPCSRQLTAGQWHDARWQQIALNLGCDGKQHYNSPGHKTVNTGINHAVYAWKATCPNCKHSGLVKRRSKRACCGICVRETGQYFNWIYTPNK